MNLLQSIKLAGIASLALGSSLSFASLTFDADGAGGDAAVQADLFDWSPSSFLAQNGTLAISNWNATKVKLTTLANPKPTDAEVTTACGTSCHIEVYTHASLISTSLTSGTVTTPSGLGSNYEITITAHFTEIVTGAGVFGGNDVASFDTVAGPAHLEMFFDDFSGGTLAANNLLGNGFNDGKLILSSTSIGDSTGFFQVTGGPVALDQAGADDYGMDSVTGSGTQGDIEMAAFDLDFSHFITDLADFSFSFANISQNLPFVSVDPSECFTDSFGGTAVGGTRLNAAADCDAVFGLMGPDGQGGYAPMLGLINGLGFGGDDFIAQTDFNSPVSGTTPSPAPLALMSIGLLGLGFFGRKKGKQNAS